MRRFPLRIFARQISLADKINRAENEFSEFIAETHRSNVGNETAKEDFLKFFNQSPLPEEIAENAKLSEEHSKNQTY